MEVLVALTIVVLVVAFAWPALASLRERLNDAKCVASLRATGQAILAHATDHNGQSVLAYYDPSRSSIPDQGEYWHQRLRREGYLDASRKNLVCPSFRPHRYDTANSSAGMYTYGLRKEGYAPAVSLANVEKPASYILLADSYAPSTDSQFYYIGWPGAGNAQKFHLRHAGKANIFFADGSVRPLSADEILALNDGWDRKTVNPIKK